ncbi:hypothetical protein [Abyssibius alkaniclasticus]|uniref:hypothetical protein n=1 Tax=Abyssibius alkaniclasticus TaxID=2881234 RepID=UPI00405976A5
MAEQGQIIIATQYHDDTSAALQAWGRRSLLPLWMQAAQLLGGCVLGITSAAGILFLTQIGLYEIDPQLVNGAWRLFPLVTFTALLFLWSRAMRFQMGKMSRPIGDGAERYRFHAEGFEEEIDGAARQYDWRMVGDMAAKRDALFLRTGTVLHAVYLGEIEDKAARAALVARIRALWQAAK